MKTIAALVCWTSFVLATNPTVASPQDTDEFAGIPSVERTIDANDKKKYFQIGPKEGAEEPEGGWKVLMILPGGDGSADFNPFCRRIHMNALPEDYIAVELIAPAWSNDDNRIVWPTKKLNPEKAKFTTEQLIADSIADLKTHVEINDRFVFALGWSSGGPPLYVNSVTRDSPVTGTFVAMSVFHPKQMPNLSLAKEHPYFILHSPDDWIKIDQHAREAIKTLDKAGAKTHLQLYDGGHGWVNDPYGNINKGVLWLQENVPVAEPEK